MSFRFSAFISLFVMVLLLVSCSETTKPDQVAIPVFTPAGGNYTAWQTVSITCATDGAEIRYTADGSAPGTTSTLYTQPISVAANTTLKARAFKDGMTPSQVAQSDYGINIPQIPGFVYVQGGRVMTYRSVYATVSSFYIGIKEVTQSQFMNVMGFNPTNFGDHPNCPADSITWYHAIAYCNKRSILEGLTPCYTYSGHGSDPGVWPAGWQSDNLAQQYISCDWDANGYRLPAEMEWQFAVKGGLLSQGYDFSGSDDIDSVAWYAYNSGGFTHDVGLKQANELGIFDMTGNVYEWCWDIAGDWPNLDVTDYHGPSSGWYRVFRGGGWSTTPGASYVWHRNNTYPTYTIDYFGFRVCRTHP